MPFAMFHYLRVLLVILAMALMVNALWIPIKGKLSQYLIRISWQHYEKTGDVIKPWPWADTHPIAMMSFPRLEESIVILNGGDETTLAFSAGAITPFNQPNTVMPFVVAGHRDSHFVFLANIELGDLISVKDKIGQNKQYRVVATTIVDAIQHAELALAHETLTLITCYPFNGLGSDSSQRFVITAQLIS